MKKLKFKDGTHFIGMHLSGLCDHNLLLVAKVHRRNIQQKE